MPLSSVSHATYDSKLQVCVGRATPSIMWCGARPLQIKMWVGIWAAVGLAAHFSSIIFSSRFKRYSVQL